MLRAYWRYFLYVLDHKLNVCIECWKEGLYLQGLVHDFSKFSPKEFVPYARKFYTTNNNEDTELEWKYAWLRHQHKNKHHWNYWIVNQDSKEALPMPEKYIIEMLCDWRSFSRKWGRLIKDPNHLTNKMMGASGLVLHPKTRQRLEEITYGGKK
ncbi:DUF5662 family protein [Paenibacillus sp. GCM10028914]|uniref:DUF5662 family protein n=1 Tax=Paenibacillus sp. GCM10028914 TaxID=3273416 RepID=UPI00361CDFB2